jgi:RNA polymerase II transcription factor SIII (Elongin) subunit A
MNDLQDMETQKGPQGARPLVSMALDIVRRHVASLDDVGDAPPKLILPILKHIHRPEQLALIEENSPHLKDHTHELWFNFIKRDCFGWDNILLTKRKKNGELWTVDEVKQKATWTTYQRCLEKSEKSEEEALLALEKNMSAEKKQAESRETRVLQNLPSGWLRKRGHKPTGKVTELKNMIAKHRREEVNSGLAKPGKPLARPTHFLNRGAMGMAGPNQAARRILPPMRRLTAAPADKSTTESKMKSISPKLQELLPSPIKSSTAERSQAPEARNTETAQTTQGNQPPRPRPPKRKAPPTVLLPMKREKR